ncbi:YdiU family protein [bacterium]|nr:YdiU family protein [bacterium]
MPHTDPHATSPDAGWHWDPSYARLPEMLFERTRPAQVREPQLRILNRALASSLGLDPDVLENSENAAIFAGNRTPDGSEPIAQAYAGHQYGHFTSLGDGRAILLGEQITPDGRRVDIQLKGSGRTAFSRGGDGRAAFGPMLREYIISEAMHGLGIPTTRSLAVATTGEQVMRTEVLPGAVLTRVAASHIRVGTFQYAAAVEDLAALRALADHTQQRHFPKVAAGDFFGFYEAVMDRQAALVAQWLHVGFIHGVMNTDNMALSGETIDYGPCAFMNAYDPDTVFSSIDRGGRYAYGNQASIARWNLARLAEAMLPLLDADRKKAVDLANEALGGFESRFQGYWLAGMRAKLGLFTAEKEDSQLVQDLLDCMQARQMDFTNTFRALSEESAIADPDFVEWHGRWKERLQRQPQSSVEVAEHMRAHNPAVIPRNHLVEEALAAASERGDLGVTERLLAVLARPYASDAPSEFALPPPSGAPVYQTFCGT